MEFAGTAGTYLLHTFSCQGLLEHFVVSSSSTFGDGITPAAADVMSRALVAKELNRDLQWSEGSYRGFFTLTIDTEKVNATYWAMRNLSKPLYLDCIKLQEIQCHPGFPNLDAFPSAEFIVEKGDYI